MPSLPPHFTVSPQQTTSGLHNIIIPKRSLETSALDFSVAGSSDYISEMKIHLQGRHDRNKGVEKGIDQGIDQGTFPGVRSTQLFSSFTKGDPKAVHRSMNVQVAHLRDLLMAKVGYF
ncbi:hypothetical protein MMC14_001490 [Varicellaria rhodocarpa]|nr:hypothetical protein [Varicellaria rhodocarpa]